MGKGVTRRGEGMKRQFGVRKWNVDYIPPKFYIPGGDGIRKRIVEYIPHKLYIPREKRMLGMEIISEIWKRIGWITISTNFTSQGLF